MKQHLNFSWKFIDNYDESYLKKFPSEAEIVDIPHNIKDLPYDQQRVLLRSSVGKIVVFPDKLILFTVMQGEAYIIINKKGIS